MKRLWGGGALLLVLLASAGRHVLEATMLRHMLVQIPMLLAAGVCIALAFRVPRARAVAHGNDSSPWNPFGIAGLLFVSAAVATWMIPRALDAAVEHSRIDVLKGFSLVLAGFVAQRSWHVAPSPVRAFAAGNMAWMTATVGMLLLDAPVRLCTSYASTDQSDTGRTMIVLTVIGVIAAGVRVWLGAPVHAQAPFATVSSEDYREAHAAVRTATRIAPDSRTFRSTHHVPHSDTAST